MIPRGRDVVAEAARSNVLLSPVIALLGLASTLIVVRVLEPEAFALYAIAVALRSTIQWLSDVGMGTASARAFAEMRTRGVRGQALALYRRLALIRVAASLLLVGVVSGFPDRAVDLLGLAPDERFFLTAALVMGVAEIVAALGVYALTGTFGQPTINRIVLFQLVVQTAGVCVAAVAGLGLEGILGVLAATSVLKAVALNLSALRALRELADGGDPLTGLRATYAAVGGAATLGKAASWVQSRPAITLIVAAALGRRDVALFAVAYDFVHQVLNVASGPLYSLMLPVFASRNESPEASAELLRRTSRALALIAFPLAGLIVCIYAYLAPVMFGDFYADSFPYAAVVAVGFALEIVLSGPATSLILAREGLIRSYVAIKVVTLAAFALYLPLAATSLLAVTLTMMGVRVLSAGALHVALWRRLRERLDYRWGARLVAVTALAGAVSASLAAVAPSRWVALAVIPLAFTVVLVSGVRRLRLLGIDDAALVLRVVPRIEPALRLLRPS